MRPHVPYVPVPTPARRVTLLTDFGTTDGYVAAMKGVISTITPDVIMDDASHDIPPGDIDAAAWALGAYWRRYGAGTVHLVVVDPGVGSARRAIAATIDGRHFVAPDNGVLTRALADCNKKKIVEITQRWLQGDDVSATFHGRDIFAPAAAQLAGDAKLDDLGPEINDPVLLSLPQPTRDNDTITGVIVHIDHFGNLITNIPAESIMQGARVVLADREFPLVNTYSDVAPSGLLALIGSRNVLEISMAQGNAAELLGLKRGAVVTAIALH